MMEMKCVSLRQVGILLGQNGWDVILALGNPEREREKNCIAFNFNSFIPGNNSSVDVCIYTVLNCVLYFHMILLGLK